MRKRGKRGKLGGDSERRDEIGRGERKRQRKEAENVSKTGV